MNDGAAPSAAGFEALVRAHQSRVRQQLRRLAHGDHALADDLAQETFIQAWRHLDTFRGQARIGTWLYRIAYNVFLAHCRRSRAPAVGSDAMEETLEPDPSHASLQRLDIDRALARLPERERVALIHCFGLDLSHGEAAEVLGWPVGTLKSHVARGKARMRDQLAAWQPPAAKDTA